MRTTRSMRFANKSENFGKNDMTTRVMLPNDDSEDGSSSSAATSKNSRADSKSSAMASSGNGGDNLLNIGKGVSRRTLTALTTSIPTSRIVVIWASADGNSSITSNTSGNNIFWCCATRGPGPKIFSSRC